MDKKVIIFSSVNLIFILMAFYGYSQGIKVRIATNTGMLIKEAGVGEIIAEPNINVDEGDGDFKIEAALGIEAEIIVPIGEYFGVGIEAENVKLRGNNQEPPFYNYFASSYSPIVTYGCEPLRYETNISNLLATARLYPIGHNIFTPFIKIYGGLALIGTNLRFDKVEDQTNIYDPLYSRGTNLSVAETEKYKTMHIGGGLGFEYFISDNIAFDAGINLSYISSDILNGVPNFTYDETLGYSVYQEAASITTQISAGLSFTFGDSPKKSRGKRGRGASWMPFRR